MYINSPMFKLTISLLIFILSILPSQADLINKIEVTGNKRISKETIINFSDLTVGDEISEDQLNNSLKELYNSKFFENIDFKISEDTLFINVKEFPIIQEIKINGIKSNSQIESLKEELNLKEKNPFDKNLIQTDVNNILNAFKHSGFYFAKINALVKNKTRDIAILKSIGVLNKSIVKIFFLIGVIIGTSATIFGIILGVTFSMYVENFRQFLSTVFNISLFPEEIYFLSSMPSEINSFSIFIISCCSILITIIVSIFPALKAAKLDPIKALKYE